MGRSLLLSCDAGMEWSWGREKKTVSLRCMNLIEMSCLPPCMQVSTTSLSDPVPWDSSRSFGDALLAPTEIYVKRLLSLIDIVDVKVSAAATVAHPLASSCGDSCLSWRWKLRSLHASMALLQALSLQGSGLQGVVHITGGGFPENIPRIVPKGKDLGFRIQKSAWNVPPLFQWLQQVKASDLPHVKGLPVRHRLPYSQACYMMLKPSRRCWKVLHANRARAYAGRHGRGVRDVSDI